MKPKADKTKPSRCKNEDTEHLHRVIKPILAKAKFKKKVSFQILGKSNSSDNILIKPTCSKQTKNHSLHTLDLVNEMNALVQSNNMAGDLIITSDKHQGVRYNLLVNKLFSKAKMLSTQSNQDSKDTENDHATNKAIKPSSMFSRTGSFSISHSRFGEHSKTDTNETVKGINNSQPINTTDTFIDNTFSQTLNQFHISDNNLNSNVSYTQISGHNDSVNSFLTICTKTTENDEDIDLDCNNNAKSDREVQIDDSSESISETKGENTVEIDEILECNMNYHDVLQQIDNCLNNLQTCCCDVKEIDNSADDTKNSQRSESLVLSHTSITELNSSNHFLNIASKEEENNLSQAITPDKTGSFREDSTNNEDCVIIQGDENDKTFQFQDDLNAVSFSQNIDLCRTETVNNELNSEKNCNLTYINEGDVSKSIQKKFNARNLRSLLLCPVLNCNRYFSTYEKLKEHLQSMYHSSVSPLSRIVDENVSNLEIHYLCPSCTFHSEKESICIGHMIEERHSLCLNSIPYRLVACPTCFEWFTSFKETEQHMQEAQHFMNPLGFSGVDGSPNGKNEVPIPIPVVIEQYILRRCKELQSYVYCETCRRVVEHGQELMLHVHQQHTVVSKSSRSLVDVIKEMITSESCGSCSQLIYDNPPERNSLAVHMSCPFKGPILSIPAHTASEFFRRCGITGTRTANETNYEERENSAKSCRSLMCQGNVSIKRTCKERDNNIRKNISCPLLFGTETSLTMNGSTVNTGDTQTTSESDRLSNDDDGQCIANNTTKPIISKSVAKCIENTQNTSDLITHENNGIPLSKSFEDNAPKDKDSIQSIDSNKLDSLHTHNNVVVTTSDTNSSNTSLSVDRFRTDITNSLESCINQLNSSIHITKDDQELTESERINKNINNFLNSDSLISQVRNEISNFRIETNEQSEEFLTFSDIRRNDSPKETGQALINKNVLSATNKSILVCSNNAVLSGKESEKSEKNFAKSDYESIDTKQFGRRTSYHNILSEIEELERERSSGCSTVNLNRDISDTAHILPVVEGQAEIRSESDVSCVDIKNSYRHCRTNTCCSSPDLNSDHYICNQHLLEDTPSCIVLNPYCPTHTMINKSKCEINLNELNNPLQSQNLAPEYEVEELLTPSKSVNDNLAFFNIGENDYFILSDSYLHNEPQMSSNCIQREHNDDWLDNETFIDFDPFSELTDTSLQITDPSLQNYPLATSIPHCSYWNSDFTNFKTDNLYQMSPCCEKKLISISSTDCFTLKNQLHDSNQLAENQQNVGGMVMNTQNRIISDSVEKSTQNRYTAYSSIKNSDCFVLSKSKNSSQNFLESCFEDVKETDLFLLSKDVIGGNVKTKKENKADSQCYFTQTLKKKQGNSDDNRLRASKSFFETAIWPKRKWLLSHASSSFIATDNTNLGSVQSTYILNNGAHLQENELTEPNEANSNHTGFLIDNKCNFIDTEAKLTTFTLKNSESDKSAKSQLLFSKKEKVIEHKVLSKSGESSVSIPNLSHVAGSLRSRIETRSCTKQAFIKNLRSKGRLTQNTHLEMFKKQSNREKVRINYLNKNIKGKTSNIRNVGANKSNTDTAKSRNNANAAKGSERCMESEINTIGLPKEKLMNCNNNQRRRINIKGRKNDNNICYPSHEKQATCSVNLVSICDDSKTKTKTKNTDCTFVPETSRPRKRGSREISNRSGDNSLSHQTQNPSKRLKIKNNS